MIYLTASSNSSTLERAKLTAPSAYLLKLFEDRKLETTIPIALYKHQLEEELRESEGRFRMLVEHAPEAIVVFDADLNCFVDANGSAEHLFALKREALLRVGQLEVSPPFQPDGRLSSEATRPRWQEELKETGHCIELVTDLEAVPPIRAAQAGLYDILVNLIFNAVDALPRGGNIRICSRALEEGVQLTISDTGAGMDEKTQQRIFEPFFTRSSFITVRGRSTDKPH